jgi:Cu(I)/Ag(I) efflux system membrane fusion protein
MRKLAIAIVLLAGLAVVAYRFSAPQTSQPTSDQASMSVPKAGGPAKSRKILYYRNAMGSPDTSPTPKKDSMGMDYVPVYEGEDADEGSEFKLSLDRVQRAGVRSEEAGMRRLSRPIRAPGVARLDERTLRIVTLRSDGFIEKLYVNESGRAVQAGEPLFRVYSPQMVSAQVDYRTATAYGSRARDEQSAVQRLKNLDIPDAVINRLRANPSPQMSIDWPAPISGLVLEKKIIEGQMAKAGEELFRIADLSRIWVIADVPELELGGIDVGSRATVTFRAYPTEPREGKVTFVLHEIDPKTRTAKIRIELDNADLKLKHEMYADVSIEPSGESVERLSVPISAVIDSGTRQVVLIEREEGRFESRQVKLGVRGEDYVEVREGLQAGEKVVVSANFLLDAESNLKAALKAFGRTPSGAPDQSTTAGAGPVGHKHSSRAETSQ